jgi:hypothetical protein
MKCIPLHISKEFEQIRILFPYLLEESQSYKEANTAARSKIAQHQLVID